MKTKWMSWANGLMGLWLMISPLTFAYTGSSGASAAFWNSLIVGALIAAFAYWEAFKVEGFGMSWFVATLGLWMVFAPYLLGYDAIASAFWTSSIAGWVVATLAGYQAMQASQSLAPHARH